MAIVAVLVAINSTAFVSLQRIRTAFTRYNGRLYSSRLREDHQNTSNNWGKGNPRMADNLENIKLCQLFISTRLCVMSVFKKLDLLKKCPFDWVLMVWEEDL